MRAFNKKRKPKHTTKSGFSMFEAPALGISFGYFTYGRKAKRVSVVRTEAIYGYFEIEDEIEYYITARYYKFKQIDKEVIHG